MKKRSKAMLLSAALVMLMVLTACSSVFDAAIGGKVVDADNTSTGIEGVSVFAYDSESARAAAAARWDGKSDVFIDSSVPSTRTDAQGNFSIPTVRWESSNPAYGKDADAKPVYLLFFHKDYELNAESAPVLVQSDKSNTVGYSIQMKKNTSSNTLRLNFLNTSASNTVITDSSAAFSFSYSYNDGYGEKTIDNQIPVSGISSLSLSFRNDVKYRNHNNEEVDAPEVKIFNITSGSDYAYNGKYDNEEAKVIYVQLKSTGTTTKDLYFSQRAATLTLNFRDGSLDDNNLITGRPIQFKYSVNGNPAVTATSGATGTATIRVQFEEGQNTVDVVVSDFDTSDDFSGTETDQNYYRTDSKDNGARVVYAEAKTITVTAGVDKTESIYFKPRTFIFSGFGGNLVTAGSYSTQTDSVLGDSSDDRLTVYISGANVSSFTAESVNTHASYTLNGDKIARTEHGAFSGLGAGTKLVYSYTGEHLNSYVSDDIEFRLEYSSWNSDTKYATTPAVIKINNKTAASKLTSLSLERSASENGSSARSVMYSDNVLDLRGE